MGERYANCTVHHEMHSDRRFDLLAQLAGWSRPEACWRMVELWSRCTALQTDRPPAAEIRIHLGLDGERLLVDAALGERLPGGAIRVLGGGLTGGDTDRFGWYEPLSTRAAAGGLARAEQVRQSGRGPRGRFGPAVTSDPPATHQRSASVTSDPPAITEPSPASGFRIPEEDQSPPPARDPTVPSPARDQQAAPPTKPPGDRDATPPNATPPAPPIKNTEETALRARQKRRGEIWGELEAARRRTAREIGVEARPLPVQDPGERELASLLACGDLERASTDARHAIAMAVLEARRDRSVQWLTGGIFHERAFQRLVGMTEADATRPRAGPRGGAERAPKTGRVEPRPQTDYPDGDQPL